jgi:hypothetical protein
LPFSLPNDRNEGIVAPSRQLKITHVFIAYISILALVAATPLLLFFDNFIVCGAIELYAAFAMVIIAVGIRPGEGRHLSKLIRIPVALAAIPPLWMLIQLLPLPLGGLSRSIWDSAASTLSTPLFPSISIDPGLTLIALSRYASIVGVAFVAAAVSIDRIQAERLLLALCCAVVAILLIFLATQIGGVPLPKIFNIDAVNSVAMIAGIVGIVLLTAEAILIIERYEVHQRFPDSLTQKLLIPIGIIAVGLMICALPLADNDTGHSSFAAACGFATVVIIYFVRRIGFGPKAGFLLGFLAILAVTAIVWTKGDPIPGDISLRYMTDASADVVSRDSRMINEVGPAGSGAGTFNAIDNLYGGQEPTGTFHAPTFAAQIAIELGRPALWVVVGLACILIMMCARSAFNRGRDFYYPLAGAGILVAMILNSFCDTGLTNPAVSLLVAIALGLGLGQSISRTLTR